MRDLGAFWQREQVKVDNMKVVMPTKKGSEFFFSLLDCHLFLSYDVICEIFCCYEIVVCACVWVFACVVWFDIRLSSVSVRNS